MAVDHYWVYVMENRPLCWYLVVLASVIQTFSLHWTSPFVIIFVYKCMFSQFERISPILCFLTSREDVLPTLVPKSHPSREILGWFSPFT